MSNNTKLLIYIPTYNRLERLKKCLKYLKRELSAGVEVYISNNGSTDGTAEYIDSLDWVTVSHNENNIGAKGNFYKAFQLEKKADYVWLLGDDDYVIPGSINGLLELLDQGADFIFCNTMAAPLEDMTSTFEQLDRGQIPVGIIKGKLQGTYKTFFPDLLRPEIADTLLGEFMCLCFRQNAIKIPPIDSLEEIFPHTGVLINSFHVKTPAIYCSDVRTVNFWGSQEWIKDYDYLFPTGMHYLATEYQHKYNLNLWPYYFKLLSQSLKRQANGSSMAKPIAAEIKADLFDKLITILN
jgi:glycosyltransferase involved in cell wall biosynthesis